MDVRELRQAAEAAKAALTAHKTDATAIADYVRTRNAYIKHMRDTYQEAFAALVAKPEAGADQLCKDSMGNYEEELARFPEYAAELFADQAPIVNPVPQPNPVPPAAGHPAPGQPRPGDLVAIGVDKQQKFTGDVKELNPRVFLRRIEENRELFGWTSAFTVKVVVMLTEGPAKKWMELQKTLGEPFMASYELLKPEFLKRYKYTATYAEKAALIDSCRQRSDHQDALAFLDDCIHVALTLDDGNDNDDEQITRKAARLENAALFFSIGCSPEVRNQMAIDEAKTMDDIKQSAIRAIAAKRANARATSIKGLEVAAVDTSEAGEAVDAIARRSGRKETSNNPRKGGQKDSQGAVRAKDRKENRCFHCHIAGHQKRNCYAYQRTPEYLQRQQQPRQQPQRTYQWNQPSQTAAIQAAPPAGPHFGPPQTPTPQPYTSQQLYPMPTNYGPPATFSQAGPNLTTISQQPLDMFDMINRHNTGQ